MNEVGGITVPKFKVRNAFDLTDEVFHQPIEGAKSSEPFPCREGHYESRVEDHAQVLKSPWRNQPGLLRIDAKTKGHENVHDLLCCGGGVTRWAMSKEPIIL